MSASREKKSRQELNGSGWTDPKTAREAQQRKEQRRSSILYGVIAVAFALVAVTVIVWKSNIIQKTTTAATIDGEKYTAAEISFHYEKSPRCAATSTRFDCGSRICATIAAARSDSVVAVWHAASPSSSTKPTIILFM